MKRFYIFAAILLLALYGFAGFGRVSRVADEKPPTREEQWANVEDAETRGLPKTAIGHLNPIIERALKEKAYPEAIKGFAKKIALESSTEGNEDTAEKIKRMRAAIATVPVEMRPVMHTILAHWWWDHFRHEDGLFRDRSVTSDLSDPDIRTWDQMRVFVEIGKSFDQALASEKELKAIPIDQYSFLLTKGSIPDTYRPTLYDFLAFEALSFYTTDEHARGKPQDAYDLPADSPIFGTVEEFLKWEPKATDANSKTIKAIKLYQKLLAFHKDDQDKSALLDTSLHRLRFGWIKAVGEKRNANYKSTLEAFIKSNAAHELSAMAYFFLASVAQSEGDLVKAREIAKTGMKTFPDSPGGKLCFNLIDFIESKSASVATERVWADPLPTIQVTFKNITKAYFRVVPADYIERMKGNSVRPEVLREEEAKALLSEKPVREFSRDLPATPDYKERTERIPAPADLKPGFYYLVVSHAENFGEENNSVSYAGFWVSNLAIVTRFEHGKGEMAGIVTDNRSGEPIAGAKVELWSLKSLNGWQPGKTATTDASGLYHIAANSERLHIVVATHNGQQLASDNEKTVEAYERDESPGEKVVVFTDRSLYRPGQTIQYKGIYVYFDRAKGKYEVVANRDVEVVFIDTNYKEIARHKAKTNDYGSVSGSFTAPRDRLTGTMAISVDSDNKGQLGVAHVNVEEYKRPKFKVELEVPKEAAKLNTLVKVPGKAIQYNGVPVSGAKVSFRVTRDTPDPNWYFARRGWRMAGEPAQEIAHGTVTTEPDGSFVIPFMARPDLSVPESEGPSFEYTVTADVTDGIGETRSATQVVSVGYTALRAKVLSARWQPSEKESVFIIETTTLDGAGQSAKGKFQIHSLKQPQKVARPDFANIFNFRLPFDPDNDPEPDLRQADGWEPGDVVLNADFETKPDGKTQYTVKFPPGIYRATLETEDRFGRKVATWHQFVVVDQARRRSLSSCRISSSRRSGRWRSARSLCCYGAPDMTPGGRTSRWSIAAKYCNRSGPKRARRNAFFACR
jgi:tetratricopeptide (TPR) repeat protein